MVLTGFAHTERIPGLVAAVTVDDRIVWVGSTGHADLGTRAPAAAETTWHWFSMTKIVTATAAMALAEQGRLDLDAPLSDYLPTVPAAFRAIRVHNLLDHSAGFANPVPVRWVHPAGAPGPDQRQFVDRLLARQRRPRFEPGTKAAYSNVGYLVLGEVIAAATHQAYVDHVRASVLEPLGMRASGFGYTPALMAHAATGYQPAPPGTAGVLRRLLPAGIVGGRVGRYVALNPFELDGAAYGGLIGSVTDAARFVALHATGGTLDGVRLLSERSVQGMQVIRLRGKRYDHGVGWFRRQEPGGSNRDFVEHLGGGGGFHNLMRLYPSEGIGVVIMANTTASYPSGQLADHLAQLHGRC